jgi:hypothetical protein
MLLCDHVTLGQTSRVNKFIVYKSIRWIKFQVHHIIIHPNPSCHPNNVAFVGTFQFNLLVFCYFICLKLSKLGCMNPFSKPLKLPNLVPII